LSTRWNDPEPFDEYGYPTYPLKGCLWRGACGYPYCQCPVEHDPVTSAPLRKTHPNWPIIADLVIILIILLGTLFLAAGLPWQW
jgi:hypothetical protein